MSAESNAPETEIPALFEAAPAPAPAHTPAPSPTDAPDAAEAAKGPEAAEMADVAHVVAAHDDDDDAGEGHDDGGDDDDGPGDADPDADAGAGGETAAAGADGAASPAKKKRRRRKKKKPAGLEGAPLEGGGEAGQAPVLADGEAPVRTDPTKRVVREVRAPKAAYYRSYNVGDQVFGKITEVTPDALFIDLFDKGKAVFDLREILVLEASEAQRAEHEAAANAADAADAAAPIRAERIESAEPAKSEGAASEGSEGAEADELSAASAPGAISASQAESVPEAAKAENIRPAAPPAPLAPLMPPMPPIVLEAGANFVGIVHNDGGRGGLVVLTRLPKRGALAKPRVREALDQKTTIEGLVTGAIKGGVEVDIDGLRAFAPASTMDLRPGADMRPFVGVRLDFQVTSYGKSGRDIVLSRKDLVEAEYKKIRAERLATLVVGETVRGRVRTIVSFGAFIDLGGVEGLVPLQELSHNRADNPSDVFSVGEDVEVKLIRVDEKGKIWLSRRAILEDPWATLAAKYAVGSKHTGKVVRIQPFGAFLELESGIDGLIHAADLSFERFEDINKVVKIGQEMEVVVSSLELGQRRIALHPALQGEAANEEPQRAVVSKGVKVKVISHEPNGLVVRILGVTGRLAHAFVTGAGTGTPRGTDLRKQFPTGQILEAKVLEIDPRRGEAKLSVKALLDDAERSAYNNYRKEVGRSSKFTLGDLLAKRGT